MKDAAMEHTTSSNLRGPDSGRDNCSARLLFERYETDTRFFDEIFESAEQPRAHYRMLINEMCGMPQEEVERLQDRVARSFFSTKALPSPSMATRRPSNGLSPSTAFPAFYSPGNGRTLSVALSSASRH
jgi:uncharacterized circularly permuted ATP-grasp superfamily protein